MDKDTILTALRAGIVNITFTKVNGDKREMRCTLEASKLPPQKPVDETSIKTKRKVNPDVVAVFDLDNEGWRSFRWDSITEFNTGA